MHGEPAVGEEPDVYHGPGLMGSSPGEPDQTGQARRQSTREPPGRRPGRGVADAEDHAAESEDDQDKIERVHGRGPACHGPGGDAGQAEHQGDDQEGDKDGEDVSPPNGGRHQPSEGGADRRPYGRDQGSHAHHRADATRRNLLQDDVVHEGEGDAGAQTLDGPPRQKHPEPGCQAVDDQSGEEEEVGAQEEGPAAEPPFEGGRERGYGGHDQEV